MKSYTTILHKGNGKYEEKKSVFIAEAIPIQTEEEALNFIATVKKAYSDARHHVYAYVLNENSIARFSDDREPQGTAGMPVLNVIKKSGCTNTAIVVVRYFGGTLLGAGGLVRAYTAAASDAIRDAEIITYDIFDSYEIFISYPDYQKINNLCSEFDLRITDTVFADNVKISFNIRKTDTERFLKALKELTCARAETHFLGEKFDF